MSKKQVEEIEDQVKRTIIDERTCKNTFVENGGFGSDFVKVAVAMKTMEKEEYNNLL